MVKYADKLTQTWVLVKPYKLLTQPIPMQLYIHIHIYIHNIHTYIFTLSAFPKRNSFPKVAKTKFANIYCSPLEKSLPSVHTLEPTRSLHLDFALACAIIGCLQ